MAVGPACGYAADVSAAAPILAVTPRAPQRILPAPLGYAATLLLAALAGGVAAAGNLEDATAIGLGRAVIVGVPLAVGFHAWHSRRAGRFGGLLMLLGLFTQPVAFILSGEMAYAYFQAHAPRSAWPILNGGEPAALFCFIWLYFAAAGPGPISVDRVMRRGRR